MKNTRKHLIGLMIGLLIPAVFAVFVLFGCDEEVNYVLPSGYETVDGEYRVEIMEVEDTCYPDEELSEPWWDSFEVFVNEKLDDGAYTVDAMISGELWLAAMAIGPEGDVNYEYLDEWWGENYLFTGKLTPQEVDATLTIQALDWDGELICYITYGVKGYKLYVNAPPPEGYDR